MEHKTLEKYPADQVDFSVVTACAYQDPDHALWLE